MKAIKLRTRALVAVVGLLSAGTWFAPSTSTAGASTPCRLPRFGPGKDYHPHIEPREFSPIVDNPYFPLTPGRVLVYTGVKDGKKAMDIFAPSFRTKVIDGVRTRVVEDRNYLDDILEERTSDYYAQDRCGNVWYFGEDTAELDRNGHVIDTEGSFHAGLDGAQPGVFMQNEPKVGLHFRQEWYQGQAEDTFSVISLDTQVTVPAGSFRHALLTRETTALEPGIVDHKQYVKGIGEVQEVTVKGPREKFVLAEVIH
jgi:hypothetical protein